VVIGVGVDILIMLLVVPFDVWLEIAAVITASSLGIIWRSLHNELHEDLPRGD